MSTEDHPLRVFGSTLWVMASMLVSGKLESDIAASLANHLLNPIEAFIMFSQNKKVNLAVSITLGVTAFQLFAPGAVAAGPMPTPAMPAPTAFHALATPLQPAAKAVAPIFHAPSAPMAAPSALHTALPTAVFHAPAAVAAPVHTILAAPHLAAPHLSAPTLAPVFSAAKAATPTTGGLHLPVIMKAAPIAAPITAIHTLAPSVSTTGSAPITLNHQLPSVINVVRSFAAPITTGASVAHTGVIAPHLSGVIAPVVGSIASGNHAQGIVAPVIGSIASGNRGGSIAAPIQGIVAPVISNIASGHLLNNVGNGGSIAAPITAAVGNIAGGKLLNNIGNGAITATVSKAANVGGVLNGSTGSINILSGNAGHAMPTSTIGGIVNGLARGGVLNNAAGGALNNVASGALGSVANGSLNNVLTKGINVNLATLAAPVNAPISVNAPVSLGNGSPVGLSVLNSAVKDVSAAVSPSNILTGTAIAPALSQIVDAPVSALAGGALPVEGNTLSIQSLNVVQAANGLLSGSMPVSALSNLGGVNTGSTTVDGITGTTASGNSLLPGVTAAVSNILGGNSTTTPVSALNNLGGLLTGATSVTGTSGSTASGNGLLTGLNSTVSDVLGGNTTSSPAGILNNLGGLTGGATSTSGSTGSTLSGLTSTATNLFGGATSTGSSTTSTTTGLVQDVTGILAGVLSGFTASNSTGTTPTTTTSTPPATTTTSPAPTTTSASPGTHLNRGGDPALAAYYAALNPQANGGAIMILNGVATTVSPASYLQMLIAMYDQAIASGNSAFASALLFDIKQVNSTVATNLTNGKTPTGGTSITASTPSTGSTGSTGTGTQTTANSGKGLQLNLGSSGIPGSNTLSLLGNLTSGAPVAVNFTPSNSPLNSSAALGALKIPLLNLNGLTGQ